MDQNQTNLTILFPNPGFFLVGAQLQVELDGTMVYNGDFGTGFQYTTPINPGNHQIVTRIGAGMVQRRKGYSVSIGDAPNYTVTLKYSRFWGNFAGKCKVEP